MYEILRSASCKFSNPTFFLTLLSSVLAYDQVSTVTVSYHQMKRWWYKPGHVNCVCVIEIWLMSWYRYKPAPKNLDADNTHCWETTVIFLVSTYQYIASAFVFSKGPPFREPIYKNGMVLLININLKIFYFICTSRTTRKETMSCYV